MAAPRPKRDWLVAFDLEDTLYPEEMFVQSGFASIERALRRLFNAGGFARRAWSWYNLGERGEKVLDLALSEMGLPRDRQTLDFLSRLYEAHGPAIAPYADVVPALQTLHMRAAVAILTDDPPGLQERKIKALKIDHFIHRAISTDEWGKEFWKPHPRGYLELQEWMGVPPHRCLYVGDNPLVDFHAPRKLGWHCLRARRRDGRHAAVEVPEELGMIPYCRDFTDFQQFVMFKNPELGIEIT